MRKSNEYRAFAVHCLTFAKNSPNTADKTRLLTMAEAWLDLADRRTRVVKRPSAPIADHPLVLKTLRRYSWTEAE
jgi:hypothetical protein